MEGTTSPTRSNLGLTFSLKDAVVDSVRWWLRGVDEEGIFVDTHLVMKGPLLRKKSGIDQTLQSARRSVHGRMVNGSEVLSWTPLPVQMWSRTRRQPLVVSTYKQCKVQLLPKMEVRGSSRFLRLLRASRCMQMVMNWIIRFYTTKTEKDGANRQTFGHWTVRSTSWAMLIAFMSSLNSLWSNFGVSLLWFLD